MTLPILMPQNQEPTPKTKEGLKLKQQLLAFQRYIDFLKFLGSHSNKEKLLAGVVLNLENFFTTHVSYTSKISD